MGDSTMQPANADYRRKIVTADQMRRIIQQQRDNANHRSARVVQCHGCFDIVHPGHIRYLQFARSQGDILVVSITGDAAIDKGAQRPYIPQELRAESLAALEFVDYVVIDPNPTACHILQTLRPDLYVKGEEYATSKDPRFLAEREVVESYGGRVVFSSGQVVFSSGRLGESLHAGATLEADRLRLVCRRHAIDAAQTSRLIDAMHGTRLLILGDLVVERYVLCDAANVATESPMMSLSELDRQDHLGGAAILAMQAAALGAEPTLVTGVARDARSQWAIETLQAAGVQVDALPYRPELAIQTRFLVDNTKLFKVGRIAIRPLDSIGERQIADILLAHAAHAEAAILYDSGYGVITPGLLQQLGSTFRRQLRIIAAGAAEPHGDIAALRYFDLLCTSERRLRAALNDLGGGLSTLAYRIMQTTQCRQMLVTLGKRGLVTFDRRSHDRDDRDWSGRLLSEHLPSFAGSVVDRLGCAEVMLTTATLAMAGGAELMQAAYLANAAAAMKLGALGPLPIDATRMQQWLARRDELRRESEPNETVGWAPPTTIREAAHELVVNSNATE